MTAFPTVRVAGIQATPVILDAQGCVEKAEVAAAAAAVCLTELAAMIDVVWPARGGFGRAKAWASAACVSAKAMPGEANQRAAYALSSRHSSGRRASPASKNAWPSDSKNERCAQANSQECARSTRRNAWRASS